MAFIILEGPDGSGKSTLADEIKTQFADNQRRLGREAVINHQHIGAPAPRPAGQTREEFAEAEYDRLAAMVTCYDPHDEDLLFIYDRFHGGSPTYGALYLDDVDPVFGQLGATYFAHLETGLAARGAVTAYLLPEVETTYRRAVVRPTGTDDFLDDRSVESQELTAARNAAKDAMRRRDAVIHDDSIPVNEKMAAAQDVSNALDAVTEATTRAHRARRQQLEDIRERYIKLTTTHREVLASYLGHPLYIDRSQPGEQVPPVGYSKDLGNVASYLLHKATIAGAKATRDLVTGRTRLPLPTPMVDCWGALVFTAPIASADAGLVA